MNTFSKSVDMLHRALDASSLRYQVSANNLANSEVPNFKRSSVNFESELKKALDSDENADKTLKLQVSDPSHIELQNSVDYSTIKPRRVLDYTTTAKANGNNVDAEQEAMLVLKTQMQYQLLTQMESFQFSQIKIAMK